MWPKVSRNTACSKSNVNIGCKDVKIAFPTLCTHENRLIDLRAVASNLDLRKSRKISRRHTCHTHIFIHSFYTFPQARSQCTFSLLLLLQMCGSVPLPRRHSHRGRPPHPPPVHPGLVGVGVGGVPDPRRPYEFSYGVSDPVRKEGGKEVYCKINI